MTPTPKLDAAIRESRERAIAAIESKNTLDALAAETEMRLLDKKRDFIRHATRLAESLLATAEHVENQPLDHHSLNSLGEVIACSTALDCDRTCIEIGALRQMLDDIARAKRAATR